MEFKNAILFVSSASPSSTFTLECGICMTVFVTLHITRYARMYAIANGVM